MRNKSIQSGLCVDSRLAGSTPFRLFAFPDQKIPALFLERSNFAQYRFDVLPLLLKDCAPSFQYFEEAFDLDLFVLGCVVQVDELADFGQR